MTAPHPFSRRKALKLGAAAAALPLVHIRTAGAAGKLSIGFWDHWVPAGNDVMSKQVAAWAEKNKVDVQADFITSDRQQEPADHGRRGAGQDRPRHAGVPDLGGARTTPTSWSRWTT